MARTAMRLSGTVRMAAIAAGWLVFAAPLQAADPEPITIPVQGTQLIIAQDQQLMFQAAQAVIRKDYPNALQLYGQVISVSPSNIEAYIQRAVVKREMQDEAGCQMDAAMAVRLSDAVVAREPGNAIAYYQRGMSYRLLKDFAKARENIRYAKQLAGGQHTEWDTDLRAIDLEEKMNQ